MKLTYYVIIGLLLSVSAFISIMEIIIQIDLSQVESSTDCIYGDDSVTCESSSGLRWLPRAILVAGLVSVSVIIYQKKIK